MKRLLFKTSNLSILLLIAVVALSFFGVAMLEHPTVTDAQTSSTVPCGGFSSSDFQSSSFYQGYGVPWDVSSPGTTLLSAQCSGGNAFIFSGTGATNEYIWNTAYVSKNGGAWNPVPLQGGTRQSGWIIGKGFAALPKSDFDPSGTNYVLTYVCTSVGGKWQCGCRDKNTCDGSGLWQLQTVKPASSGGSAPSLPSLGNIHVSSPTFFYPSNYVVSRGGAASISGAGLSNVQSITFEGYGNVNTDTRTDSKITFTIPNDIPYGRYDVSTDEGGTPGSSVFLIVKDPGTSEPVIQSLSEQTIHPGDTLIIHGSGFDRLSNDIRTNFGMIKNIPSTDGATLTFTFPENQVLPTQVIAAIQARGMTVEQFREDQEEGMRKNPPSSQPMQIIVINKNGMSAQKQALFNPLKP